MKIGWTRPILRTVAPGVALAAALAMTPRAVASQTAPQQSLLRALGDHYELPADEVAILAEWRIPVGEIPVALAISDHASISPDALVASRRNGRDWATLAGRYGMDMGWFHVPLDPVPQPVVALYAELESRPRARWGEVRPDDAQVVFLVNVRFLQEYASVSADVAAAALAEHGGLAEALRAISP